jgi:hypothetical protein
LSDAVPEEVTLIDESGAERRFTLHDAFDLDGAAYYLVEEVADPERVMLLRESGHGLETVDGEEFNRVMKAIEQDRID